MSREAAYDYLILGFERPAARDAAQRGAAVAKAVAAEGGALLGQFTAQLGWPANEAALLLRASPGASAADAALRAAAPLSHTRRRLSPTVRPQDGETPIAGGVHVHRWFIVAAADVAEFTLLSARAWPSFEGQFDARIFGLFRAEPAAGEAADGAALLLVTRYGDHGVWEASRDPTTEAMQIFARRQALTRRTWAASSLLVG